MHLTVQVSQLIPPSLTKRRPRTTPKSSPIIGKDLIDYEGKPSSSKFWYGSQSLCPTGEP